MSFFFLFLFLTFFFNVWSMIVPLIRAQRTNDLVFFSPWSNVLPRCSTSLNNRRNIKLVWRTQITELERGPARYIRTRGHSDPNFPERWILELNSFAIFAASNTKGSTFLIGKVWHTIRSVNYNILRYFPPFLERSVSSQRTPSPRNAFPSRSATCFSGWLRM